MTSQLEPFIAPGIDMNALTPPDPNSYLQERLLSRRLLAEYLGVDQATIARWTQTTGNDFPKPFYLTPSTKRWRLSDINNWINQKANEQ